jgi:hypothetical protein
VGGDALRISVMFVVALAGCETGVANHPVGTTLASDSSLYFAPTNVIFTRYPAICGVADPPFTDDDLFDLDVLGAGVIPTSIDISCARSVPLNSDLGVQLMPFGILAYNVDANGNMTNVDYGQLGSLAAGKLHFIWAQGVNSDGVDSAPLTSVDIRFAAFPQHDGDDVDVQIKMLFQDGGLLDVDVREPLPPVPGPNSCPLP